MPVQVLDGALEREPWDTGDLAAETSSSAIG